MQSDAPDPPTVPHASRPAEEDAASIDRVSHLVLRLGRLLLENGADTELARTRMERFANALGGSAEVFISNERLLLTLVSGQVYRTRIGSPIQAMGVNLGRLGSLEAIARAIEQGDIDVDEGGRRIDAVQTSPPLHPAWLVLTAVALATASLARLFGAGWPVVAASFAAGLANAYLRRLFARRAINPTAAAFTTALVSSAVGAALLKAAPQAQPTLCLVAAGMILVPGVPLINGVADLVSGHIGVGVARLVTGAIAVVAISFALFLAAGLLGDLIPVTGNPTLLPIPEDFLFSAVAAFGFAMLFNVPTPSVWACVVCGTVSHGLRTLLETAGLDIGSATLLCAAAAGVLARWFGNRLDAPWSTFAFPGVVAMIPGAYGFRAGIGALELMRRGAQAPSELVAETLSLIVATVIVTAAVAIGLLMASAASASVARLLRGGSSS